TALRRVADDLSREPARRVAPEVERLAALLHADAAGEQGLAVRRVDEPAPDLELRDALDRVVLARREPGGGPGLPVRRRHDQRGEQEERGERDDGDLPVHVTSEFARW